MYLCVCLCVYNQHLGETTSLFNCTSFFLTKVVILFTWNMAASFFFYLTMTQFIMSTDYTQVQYFPLFNMLP